MLRGLLFLCCLAGLEAARISDASAGEQNAGALEVSELPGKRIIGCNCYRTPVCIGVAGFRSKRVNAGCRKFCCVDHGASFFKRKGLDNQCMVCGLPR